jgi:colanic acid/amylovoran biosynthesis glycosyltransferase
LSNPPGTDRPVLYVLDFIQTFIRNEMAGLALRGWKVRVSMRHRIPRLLLPFIAVARLWRVIAGAPHRFLALAAESLKLGCFRHFLIGAELAGKLAADPPARVQCHFAWEAATIGMWAARFLDIPFSVVVHARDIFVPEFPPRVGALLRASSPPIAASQYNVPLIAEKWGPEAASRIVVIHLGIDVDALPAAREQEQQPVIFCTASGLVEKKGVHVLIEACEILSRKRSGWNCVVAGSDEKGEILERYRALVKRKGLQGRIEFIGAVRSCELLELAASASVFALPCVEASDGDLDGIPVSLMEAMGIGLPVISTPVSGVPELIEDGVSGILVAPGDAEALAAAILRLLDDRALAAGMGCAAREKVLKDFSLSGHLDSLEQAWADATSGCASGNGPAGSD